MKIKPFINIQFCSRCGAPVPRAGVSLRTEAGNVTTTTPFICMNCKRKRRRQ